MKPVLLLLPLVFFFFFLTFNISSCNSQPVPAFNKYILVLQFPRSMCRSPVFRKCDTKWNMDLPPQFTIHGLWEDDWLVGSTKRASGKKFLRSEIYTNVTLRDGLYKNWIDAYVIYKSGANKNGEKRAAAEDFWQLEWNSHGQYTYLSTLDYFKTAYDLFTGVVGGDVYGQLKRDRLILPGGYINLTEATTSLRQHIGAKPFLKCIINAAKEEFLWEVEIQYRRASLGILDHYRDWKQNCTKEVVSLKV